MRTKCYQLLLLKPVEELAQGGPQSGRPCAYNRFMKQTNPYRLQMIQQGRDPIDAPIREVPARYRDRFATYEEYQEAIAEMLNGM